MDLPVFFEENISDQVITLSEETSKHVVQVLRMKVHERLKLTNGAGTLATAEITDDHKKRCSVKIIERVEVPRKEQQVSIAISLLKNASRFEWFLEKAVEIGVTEIIPLIADRTEKQHFRHERMKQIVVSAMMQSKQAWLPMLHEPAMASKVILSSPYDVKLVAHCEDEMKHDLADFRKQQSVQILIGPEGDFSVEEIGLAIDSGYKPVSLGNTRLRTETAGIVAATLLCV